MVKVVRTTILLPLIFLYSLTVPLQPVSAHPHIWIDSRVEAVLDGGRLAAIRAHWTFDAFFTQMIVLDYGEAQNGTFTAQQREAIRTGAFENLRHYGYFTSLRVDGRTVPIERVENFRASLDAEQNLVYQFDIPLNLDLTGRPREVAVAMYDESFFTDMIFREEYVLVHGSSQITWRSDLRREIYQVPVWGPMNRETVVLEFSPR